ncbi:MAG: glycosyltransferase family A protein [Sediminibacterium sp.]
MSLVVLIPTFQRPSTLEWSLQSVIAQKFYNKNITKKIYVLNNDTLTANEVEKVVNRVLQNNSKHEFEHIEILQGDQSLYVIQNWFGNLKRITNEGDIAIIHGDDDIMLPNTLMHRYEAAFLSDKCVCIGNSLWSCHFIESQPGFFIDLLSNPYESGSKFTFKSSLADNLVEIPLPFISAYAYKISDKFWSIFSLTIKWSDLLPFEPKIKYPFIPYYVGLTAHHEQQLGITSNNMVIRGQLFKLRRYLPPKTVTEYANGGITLLAGLVFLNNEFLQKNSDFNLIRYRHRKTTLHYFFQSLFKRNGMSLRDLQLLYYMSGAKFLLKEFTAPVLIKNMRHLSDNLFFTLNIGKWIKGFGKVTSPELFWQNWGMNNISK